MSDIRAHLTTDGRLCFSCSSVDAISRIVKAFPKGQWRDDDDGTTFYLVGSIERSPNGGSRVELGGN